jgi:hypothetical protein
LDYVRDPCIGDMYLIKWRGWDSDFNTWEPPANLLNCDDALLNFYRNRKEEAAQALKQTEYYVTSNGHRRRKGPSVPDVPPDPRPLDIRVKEFFDFTFPLSEEDIMVSGVPLVPYSSVLYCL